MINTRWRILKILAAFISIIAIGIIGYMVIEGWNLLDAAYMTVTTLSTVGFREVYELSTAGRIFTIFIIIGGTGTMLYAVSAIVQYLIEGQFADILGRRRMKEKISRLKGHVVLCGYGKVGKEVARVFSNENVPFVVLESDEKTSTEAINDGFLCLKLNATSDDALKEAGIMTAKALVAALGSDADNLYLTLSARSLRPDIFVVARVDNAESEAKLKRAGADRTMSPYGIGGRRLAMLAIKPVVIDFFDTTMDQRGHEITLEEVDIISGSLMDGVTIKEGIGRANGAHILAVRKKNGRLLANPSGETTLEAGDELVVMGTREQLMGIEKLT